jgi:hypothetical protein
MGWLCVPTTPQCVPPSYHEHALVSPPRRRTAALANSFPSGPASPVVPWSVPLISRVQAASPALLHTSRPQRQCRIRLAFPARILSGLRGFTKHGARCSSRNVSLHGAVPYSSPREGVQIAWIVGSRTLRLL